MTDWLRDAIEEELVVERAGWAPERVARVAERLQPTEPRLDALVIWSEEHNAFTGPGRTVYVSRRLLERLDEDATAFVVAHELAHHRLGHIPKWGSRMSVMLPFRLALHVLERAIATRDNESDADALALEMCLDAGYDADRCIAALEFLATVALDYGAIDTALGSDGAQVRGKHPTLDRRIAALRSRVEAYRRGERVSLEISRDRRSARRRRLAVAAGGLAVTVAVIVVLRRAPK